ncbi:SDR family oxidoreductase [Robertkochia flava]|uniref:SDR family oxidoreductase n=1 Tax=Robertkochia flava TaxID=3447986 RepID=UPI001CCEC4A1|nr:SDR family oxidoreductase [Robertkochia marina]
MWNLQNKKALITGGSKGIGKSCVEEFASLGAEIIFTGRNKSDLDATEREFLEKGYKVKGVVSDVTSETDRTKLWALVREEFGVLDILVNNAGMNIRKAAVSYTEEEYRDVVEVNLMAPFMLCRMFFTLLKKSGKASVINVSSVAATLDDHTGAPYGMAKSGLLQMTRSLAVEWASYGIRVNAVSPWFTLTPLTRGLLKQPEKIGPVLQRTPMRRIAEPEEVAAAIAFLAMDKASYITGQNIITDGGMSINALM